MCLLVIDDINKLLTVLLFLFNQNKKLDMRFIKFKDVYPKSFQDLFLFTEWKAMVFSLSFLDPHLRHPGISTGFFPDGNNALKVSDRLENNTERSLRLSIKELRDTQNTRGK